VGKNLILSIGLFSLGSVYYTVHIFINTSNCEGQNAVQIP
jgi:hypothetical protein